MTYCEGVKMGSMTGDTVISELRIEHQTLVSKQQTRTDALTQQIPSLQDEVNELSDENDLLQSEVCDLSSDLDQAQQTLKSLHAFAQPSEQSVVVPVATLPAYTVIKQELSTLSVAEQVYFLKVRSKLTSRDQLTTSLTELETLLKFRQMMAITSPTAENLENAAFLVDVIPQVRAIAPIIGSYLQSITGDILKINATATSSGWFAAPQLGAVQTLQLKELEIRKNLSYAIFDALFGAMVKTTTVPAAIPFATDPSAANVLASKVQTLHATLPATIPSQKLIVKDNGLISVAGDADYATEVNLTLQFMIDLQQLTVDFLKQTLGAQTLLNTTLNTSAMIQATELVQAKTILCPPPPPPALTALVTDSPLKTATITATNQSTQDDSSDSDEDSFVDGTTVKEDTTA